MSDGRAPRSRRAFAIDCIGFRIKSLSVASPAAQIKRTGSQFVQFTRFRLSQLFFFAYERGGKRNWLTAMNAEDTAIFFVLCFGDHFYPVSERSRNLEEAGF